MTQKLYETNCLNSSITENHQKRKNELQQKLREGLTSEIHNLDFLLKDEIFFIKKRLMSLEERKNSNLNFSKDIQPKN